MRGGSAAKWAAVLAGALIFLAGQAFAQDEIKVVRGDDDYPPFEMVVDGKLSGIHVEIVNAAAARIGVKVTWESLPWKRALLMVETGTADAVTYIGKTPERETWATFLDDNLLSSAKINFIVRKGDADKIHFDGNLARFMEGRTPIVLRGFKFGNEVLDKGRRIETNTMNDMVRLLKEGHSDVAVVNWSDFVGAFKGMAAFNEVVALKPPASEVNNYVAFSKVKKNPELALRFASAVKAYKASPAYAAMVKRYK